MERKQIILKRYFNEKDESITVTSKEIKDKLQKLNEQNQITKNMSPTEKYKYLSKK